MRIIRLHMVRFRGYADTEIFPGSHAVIVGEPRAGRSDMVRALRRVLDPRSTNGRANPLDVHLPRPQVEDLHTEVEVTIVDLDEALEQELEDRLELIDESTGLPCAEDGAQNAERGVRLRYNLRYDPVSDTGEHWVEYPATQLRVPRTEREMLSPVFIDRSAPLQLRADGIFRQLATATDEPSLRGALGKLSSDIEIATDTLAANDAIGQTIVDVLSAGTAELLDMTGPDPEDHINFIAEDGSLAAILRAIQPTLRLDDAGLLPLASHGSTTAAILAAAEAAVVAEAPSSLVIADDFGDELDACSAEFLAARLRRNSGQVWLSTRRPEVVRAFRPEEVIRLTRSHGQRQHHRLAATTDRKVRITRRQLHLMMLPAMTARTLALVEGPHDLESYTAVAAQRFVSKKRTLPPSAYGVRLVAAGIGDGGKDQLPKLAKCAVELGFHVRVVLDNDKPGADAALIADLVSVAEQVIQLPERTAIERALVSGLNPADGLRAGLERINADFGLGLDVAKISDSDLEKQIVSSLKQKGGLHVHFIAALRKRPPLIVAVLDTLSAAPGKTVLVEIPPS